MILYHATTSKRASQISNDRCIKKDSEKFYTWELNGNGYTTQGYVYLSNELTFAIYFANSHRLVDKSESIFVFRMDLPMDIIEPDLDELCYQGASNEMIKSYGGKLQCSLQEYKSCRVPMDLYFEEYSIEYIKLHAMNSQLDALVRGAGNNYVDTINGYNDYQKKFLLNLNWTCP